jgi:hypothetical protein
MTITDFAATNNPNFLADQLDQLQHFVQQAARDGQPLRAFETQLLSTLLELGHTCMTQFLSWQGDGDLGEHLETPQGLWQRREQPQARDLRTLFGEHVYHAYVYGHDLTRRIDFRPVDVRLQRTDSKFSPRLQELTQLLCTEQAFGQAATTFAAFFEQRLSVNSLERMNQQLADSAEQFLYQVPVPTAADEGDVLVVSGDGKGIPMVRESPVHVPAFEHREHPGNRQMATLATVYSVDRFVRTPEQIVAALFRDTPDDTPVKRPQPVGKIVVGCLTRLEDGEEPMPGDIQAFTWAGEQVERRHQTGQPLVRLMDGQASLWDTSTLGLGDHVPIDILDIIHVSSYVWKAAKLLHAHREPQEAYARDWLLRILQGKVGGVMAGMRQQATKRGLSRTDRASLERLCNYFAKNRSRMRYDEYLQAGYPIATGVIEGACRHLVMDRFCRSGMRWRPVGSQAMLHLRAIHQANLGSAFHTYLARQHRNKTQHLRRLLKDYQPATLPG